MEHIDKITSYHAHVYFDAQTIDQARDLCQHASEIFGVVMGRVHARTVGPHPRWSCQLAATPDQFADLLPWLTLNRNGLTVFAHPETGDELRDHRDHGIWLGELLPLKLDIFKEI